MQQILGCAPPRVLPSDARVLALKRTNLEGGESDVAAGPRLLPDGAATPHDRVRGITHESVGLDMPSLRFMAAHEA